MNKEKYHYREITWLPFQKSETQNTSVLFFTITSEVLQTHHQSHPLAGLHYENLLYQSEVQRVAPSSIADLALIRLEKTVIFGGPIIDSRTLLLPLCLPTKDMSLQSLHGQTAYVERKGKQDKVGCLTDNLGPQKNAKCRY